MSIYAKYWSFIVYCIISTEHFSSFSATINLFYLYFNTKASILYFPWNPRDSGENCRICVWVFQNFNHQRQCLIKIKNRHNYLFWQNAFYLHALFRADLNGFTAEHIQRLPDSPRQNGTDSVLSFYATLPSGTGTVPKSTLATIFVAQQEKIFSLESVLQNQEDSVESGERRAVTPAQSRNLVPISLINFRATKVS